MNMKDFFHPMKVVSGGQTGVDRAALDWALSHDIDHGGWCPKGRLASDGRIALHYLLRETESAGYRQRTKCNVQDSDATLIVNMAQLDGGTLQTVEFAKRLKKPHLVIQLDLEPLEVLAVQVNNWLCQGRHEVVNIAGPREEKRPGISALTISLLNLSLPKTPGGT